MFHIVIDKCVRSKHKGNVLPERDKTGVNLMTGQLKLLMRHTSTSPFAPHEIAFTWEGETSAIKGGRDVNHGI